MKKDWQKQELQTAKRYKGKVQPSSGGKWGLPGDVKTEKWLIDDKTTIHNSYSIKNTVWEKICNEAIMEQRLPVLKVTLGDGTSFVCLDEIDFYELIKNNKKRKEVKK